MAHHPSAEPRILITGASGFVGSRLLSRLQQAAPGAQLLAVGGPVQQGDLRAVDLTDGRAVWRLVEDFEPSIIVHLAAQSSVGEGSRDPDVVWKANFDGTRAVAAAGKSVANKTGAPLRFVFASSAEVYGTSFTLGPCDEEAPLGPISVYGRSKAACEYVLGDMAADALDIIALRLFNHTGPGQDARFVVPALARRVAQIPAGEPGKILTGNLDTERDFTDIDDVIEAYMTVICDDRPAVGGRFRAFNVGSGVTRSMRSILLRLAELHGAPITGELDPQMLRATEIARTVGRFERFSETYGWTARHDFANTIQAILTHERSRLDTDTQ